MGIVFRQSAKTSIVVFSGSILGAIIIWLSTKYIDDKHQFGFIQNLTNNAVIISQTLLWGLGSTLSVYIQKYKDSRKKKLLITLSFAIPTILTVFFTCIYYVLHDKIISHFQPEDIPYMLHYFDWLPIYVLLFLYQMLLEQYLITQMKVAVAAFTKEVLIRLINISLLILYGIHLIPFHTFVSSVVLMYGISCIVFFLLSARTQTFGLAINLKIFSKKEYVEILHFSWYHFLLAMALILMGSMDQLLLPFYDHKGFAAVAVYRVAVFLISFLQLPTKALIPPCITVLSKAFAEENYIAAKDIFSRSSINIFIPTILLGLLVCCNLVNIASVIRNGYTDMIPVFLILFISTLINLATGMNDSVLSIAKLYKFNFYLSLFLIILLYILIRLLVPHYGIYGAAWSTTIVIIIFNIAKFLFVWKKLDMQPFSMGTVKVLVAALPALAAGYFFPYLFDRAHHVYVHSFIDASIRSILIIIIYLAMLLWLKPSPDLEEYLASVKKNKRLF